MSRKPKPDRKLRQIHQYEGSCACTVFMEEKRGRREGWRKKGEGINKKSKSDGKERFSSSREEKKKGNSYMYSLYFFSLVRSSTGRTGTALLARKRSHPALISPCANRLELAHGPYFAIIYIYLLQMKEEKEKKRRESKD